MNSTIAIGNFDGVHQGHQAVINTAKKNSKTKNTKFGVLTFEPHPKNVILTNNMIISG